jgi:hypothetical protein
LSQRKNHAQHSLFKEVVVIFEDDQLANRTSAGTSHFHGRGRRGRVLKLDDERVDVQVLEDTLGRHERETGGSATSGVENVHLACGAVVDIKLELKSFNYDALISEDVVLMLATCNAA